MPASRTVVAPVQAVAHKPVRLEPSVHKAVAARRAERGADNSAVRDIRRYSVGHTHPVAADIRPGERVVVTLGSLIHHGEDPEQFEGNLPVLPVAQLNLYVGDPLALVLPPGGQEI